MTPLIIYIVGAIVVLFIVSGRCWAEGEALFCALTWPFLLVIFVGAFIVYRLPKIARRARDAA